MSNDWEECYYSARSLLASLHSLIRLLPFFIRFSVVIVSQPVKMASEQDGSSATFHEFFLPPTPDLALDSNTRHSLSQTLHTEGVLIFRVNEDFGAEIQKVYEVTERFFTSTSLEEKKKVDPFIFPLHFASFSGFTYLLTIELKSFFSRNVE